MANDIRTAEDDWRELEEAAMLPDIHAEPGPDDPDFLAGEPSITAAAPDLSSVRWPADDRNAPDYAYVASEPDPDSFRLTGETVETLLRLNRYAPDRSSGAIALAIRGAVLGSGNEVEGASAIDLENVRPDHRNFHCVLGFYFPGTGKLNLYSGSTVPCRKAVWGFANGGTAANMLPTGLHTYYVWRHKTLRPALRLAKSSQEPEEGARAAVLRTKNDTIYGTQDKFDVSFPLDNVHCSYFLTENSDLGAAFSSWGCLTVRGEKTPSHQWKKFQAVLSGLGAKKRVDLLLATGKDLALVADGQGNPAALERRLSALRRGSRGEEVKRLQARLGFTGNAVDGAFGPDTVARLAEVQRQINQENGKGPVADGIYSREMDAITGWGVFESAVA